MHTDRDHEVNPHAQETFLGPTDAANESFDATILAPLHGVTKMEQDVAFAATVLKSGQLSDRQLAKAISDWTIHGDELLRDHLEKGGWIGDDDLVGLETQSNRLIESTVPVTGTRGNSSASTFQRLDVSGRVARLLGLTAVTGDDSDGQRRDVVAGYQLLNKLGQGGLGSVWLARDENLRRFVAVKEVNPGVRDSAAAMRRFRREAEVTGRLEHPSIVPVYQFGDDSAGGNSFYAMRYLGKKTLEDAIAEYHERREEGDHDPMLLHHLLTTFVAVCQAIAYAHSRNVVHRDLKPENVALDNYGQVIVLDWGLAKLIGEAELDEALEDDGPGDASTITQTMAGQVLGTPRYMAPEQAAGRIDDIDERTDVYGLGAILFAILTGQAPHEKSQASLSSSSAMSELFRAIVTHPTPSASSEVPEVPPELDAICRKAMARKQYARYESASDLAEDVQRWMAGEPVATYKEPWRIRCRRWIRTHPRWSQLVAATSTILIVLAITLGVNTHQNRQALKRSRFESMKHEATTMQSRLHSHAESLIQQARFMSTLPPIQGIIDARATEKAGNENGPMTDSEDVWRGRLQTIYRGLLNAHPGYLSVEYDSVSDPAKAIVRVERNSSSDSLVRVVPQSRLAELELTGPLSNIAKLAPGDVHLSTKPISYVGADHPARQQLILTAGIPVYDENTGNVFGAVAIRSDLDATLRELVSKTVTKADNVYITDREGTTLLQYSHTDGFRPASRGQSVTSDVPELSDFLSSEQTSDSFSDGQRIVAVKVDLDPRCEGAVIWLVFVLD